MADEPHADSEAPASPTAAAAVDPGLRQEPVLGASGIAARAPTIVEEAPAAAQGLPFPSQYLRDAVDVVVMAAVTGTTASVGARAVARVCALVAMPGAAEVFVPLAAFPRQLERLVPALVALMRRGGSGGGDSATRTAAACRAAAGLAAVCAQAASAKGASPVYPWDHPGMRPAVAATARRVVPEGARGRAGLRLLAAALLSTGGLVVPLASASGAVVGLAREALGAVVHCACSDAATLELCVGSRVVPLARLLAAREIVVGMRTWPDTSEGYHCERTRSTARAIKALLLDGQRDVRAAGCIAYCALTAVCRWESGRGSLLGSLPVHVAREVQGTQAAAMAKALALIGARPRGVARGRCPAVGVLPVRPWWAAAGLPLSDTLASVPLLGAQDQPEEHSADADPCDTA